MAAKVTFFSLSCQEANKTYRSSIYGTSFRAIKFGPVYQITERVYISRKSLLIRINNDLH